ncbi:unnamed protein product [Callosobruchus maculatus]|uniref:Uncharacterized protein n=1 Tax=Callosobruchus maculatus TaxID=64391 RepID=A0A653CIS8_CALMS|nr:unnamed protein product [Callosobruchus maculatus]
MKYLVAIFAIFALVAVFASAEELEERPLVSVRAPFLQQNAVGSCECNSCGQYCVSNNYIGEERPLVSVRAPFLQQDAVGSCECNSCNRYCVTYNYIGGLCVGTTCYCVKLN